MPLEDELAETELVRLLDEIRRCRICVDAPVGRPLPHEPRPVVQAQATARIAVCGQAPGTRVHVSGKPFSDASGERLRAWMGVTPEEFYDATRIAVVPMGFCFPGLDAKGGDLPPRRECARAWRAKIFAQLPKLELVLLVGGYAQKWHLGAAAGKVSDVVASWRAFVGAATGPRIYPLPHPSWRNNAWLKRSDWFDRDLLPELQRDVSRCLNPK